MNSRVATRVAAVALGLAIIVSPAAALPAMATPSIPIPPPSTEPGARRSAMTLPAGSAVYDAGPIETGAVETTLARLAAETDQTLPYPITEP
jgi:hypothetical protein